MRFCCCCFLFCCCSCREEFHRQAEVSSDVPGAAPAPQVQIRHGPISIPCTVKSIDADCKTLAVSVDKQQKLAAGQYAALYEGDECLGAGVISERTWSQAEPLTE